MENLKQLDRTKIEQALCIMGQYLLDRKTLGEIALHEGTAVLFQFDWRKISEDIVARVTSDSNCGTVIDAALEAATQLGLASSWLNESVAKYARQDEEATHCLLAGLYPSPERFGLRVVAAKPAYILAMSRHVSS
jgi:hypothetical protein